MNSADREALRLVELKRQRGGSLGTFPAARRHAVGIFLTEGTVVLLDTARESGLAPTAAAEFLHAGGQQILMDEPHMRIGEAFAALVEANDFMFHLFGLHQ